MAKRSTVNYLGHVPQLSDFALELIDRFDKGKNKQQMPDYYEEIIWQELVVCLQAVRLHRPKQVDASHRTIFEMQDDERDDDSSD